MKQIQSHHVVGTSGRTSVDGFPAVSPVQAETADVTSLTPLNRPEPKVIEGVYRKSVLSVPSETESCPGISLFGRRVKSLVFSTDLAVICNCDADAVLAVYPFTCQPVITQALVQTAGRPVLAGIAGKTTSGARSVKLAVQSEMIGASAVVVNTPTTASDIFEISQNIDIPLVLSVSKLDDEVRTKVAAGASVVNVAAGRDTAAVVEAIRLECPDLPIIASGGRTSDSVRATIAAGADAVSWTPPSIAELEHELMQRCREDDLVGGGEGLETAV